MCSAALLLFGFGDGHGSKAKAGPAWTEGEQRAVGAKCEAGPRGEPGTTGPPGKVGRKGDAGPKGNPGPKGKAGEASIRVVVADGSGLFASCPENETVIAAWCQGSS